MKLSLFLVSLVAPKKPNVIMLIADDLGAGDISLNSRLGKIKTPNIDRIGLEGANFLEAYAPSPRCGPSRFGLMTGRYSFDNSAGLGVRLLKPGTPHLGEMFKRNGYKTAIFGKHQPVADEFGSLDLSEEEVQDLKNKQNEYKKLVGDATGDKKKRDEMGIEKTSYYEPSRYYQNFITGGYDYTFINKNGCCRIGGGYFENGQGTEPFDKFATLRPYPEEKPWSLMSCYTPFDGGKRVCDKRVQGVLSPPYTDERDTSGEILIPSFPTTILVQSSYDTRDLESRVADKALQYIENNAGGKEPFFMYYGFRSGHLPFNSALKYRNTTDAGIIGEAVTELDDIIGEIIESLEQKGILDETIVMFMSDNGAISQSTADNYKRHYFWHRFNHYQNAMTLDGVDYKFKKGKAYGYEGGMRVPLLIRYPKLISQTSIRAPVSFLDLYRTVNKMINGVELGCHEAPDSRNLLPLIHGRVKKLSPNIIVHHCIKCKGHVAIRQDDMKLINDNELYNITADPEEMKNLFENNEQYSILGKQMATRLQKIVERVDSREKITNIGSEPCNIKF